MDPQIKLPASRAVIVEGTCGAGKTSLIRRLCERLGSRPEIGFRVYTQQQTYAPIAPDEDSGTLDGDLNEAILHQIVETIEAEAGACGRASLLLIDTLHITQYVRPGKLRADSFRRIERRLAALSPLVVFLAVSPEALRRRTLHQRRDTDFYRYARKFGRCEEKLLDYFVGEQERMRNVLQRESRLPSLTLDGETSGEELARQILTRVL